jgi:hypothetical protein
VVVVTHDLTIPAQRMQFLEMVSAKTLEAVHLRLGADFRILEQPLYRQERIWNAVALHLSQFNRLEEVIQAFVEDIAKTGVKLFSVLPVPVAHQDCVVVAKEHNICIRASLTMNTLRLEYAGYAF